jgi:hypothetical protein
LIHRYLRDGGVASGSFDDPLSTSVVSSTFGTS